MKTIRIGFVQRAHGVGGALKVQPLTDDVSRFQRIKEIYVEKSASLEKHALLNVSEAKDTLHIKLEGIKTREEAEALRGAYLVVERKDAIELSPGSYFICDLVGCDVQSSSGTYHGVVRDVLQHGAADVYVIERPDGRELLVPSLKRLLLSVDIENKLILVDPIVLQEVALLDED